MEEVWLVRLEPDDNSIKSRWLFMFEDERAGHRIGFVDYPPFALHLVRESDAISMLKYARDNGKLKLKDKSLSTDSFTVEELNAMPKTEAAFLLESQGFNFA